jgi:hypothetical protein
MKNAIVLHTVPEEDQVIGLREVVSLFGDNYSHIKAGSRIGWRYALLMEIAGKLVGNYRLKGTMHEWQLNRLLEPWVGGRHGVTYALRKRLTAVMPEGEASAKHIAELAARLNVKNAEEEIGTALEEAQVNCYMLIDRLDEGYGADAVGIGFVSGAVQAALDVSRSEPNCTAVIFLRDNIARAIQDLDPDYSRNLEGSVLRLHWTEYELFAMACKRLRVASGLGVENDLALWNKCVGPDLEEHRGFDRCLQLTLYRPRDLLSLLNEAFYEAERQGRERIVLQDVTRAGEEISRVRLDDLKKEYTQVIPGLPDFVGAFSGTTATMSYEGACEYVSKAVAEGPPTGQTRQEFAILGSEKEVVDTLYGIGFLGVKDTDSAAYTFCHDGKSVKSTPGPGDQLLLHPCYWRALGVKEPALQRDQAETIHDEYDIAVQSLTVEKRERNLSRLISELGRIDIGQNGETKFEEWCLQAVRIVFARSLTSFALHPNQAATQRRDVVATNVSQDGIWRRILEDYKARQVIFEVKNYASIGAEEFRQMLSYLTEPYGSIGFIITRDDHWELKKGRELDWVREIWSGHKKLILKLTAKCLCSMISKLRIPQKHDAPGKLLGKILDIYLRLYISGQTISKGKYNR